MHISHLLLIQITFIPYLVVPALAQSVGASSPDNTPTPAAATTPPYSSSPMAAATTLISTSLLPTTPATISASSSFSGSASPSALPLDSLNFYIPTASNDTQNITITDAYQLNGELFAFTVHYQYDYPTGLSSGMQVLEYYTLQDWLSCIQRCVKYNLNPSRNTSYWCGGVTFLDSICYIKSGILESSTPLLNRGAITGILHLITV